MCNLNRIAALLISATVAIASAIVLAATATALAGSWWTSSANMPIMISIAALSAFAMSSANGAAIEAAQCMSGPCKEAADKVFAALIALIAALGALTTAAIVGAFLATIPFSGVAVAAAIGFSAVAVGVTLAVVSAVLLPQLDDCRSRSGGGPLSGLVEFQKTFGLVVGGAAALAGGVVTFKGF